MTMTHDPLVSRILNRDPHLGSYAHIIGRRLSKIQTTEHRLTGGRTDLADFSAGHEFFGLHHQNDGWVFREWAPNAEHIYFIGDFSDWKENERFALQRIDEAEGTWEIQLPEEILRHNDLYRLRMHWPGGSGDRIPAFARRVVQDRHTRIFNAQVWRPENPHEWRHSLSSKKPPESLHIYEAHAGMAQEEPKVGTYLEFKEKVLPRIVRAGYDTIQFMAIQEHPYYGSFGYQVSNFFAASSRFGTPDELKALVDAAHGAGLRVIMDLVHSHAVNNEVEGLSRFDGTTYQFFHGGPRGRHSAWNSRCFDYGKHQVLHFLLSNCRFWLDEYRFDGFRFDGITSMLYLDHGLGKAFTSYGDYFNDNVDEEALTYLALANKMIHSVRPDAVTIAEDMSGMPGLAAPIHDGGYGFDYRFAMGVPDLWIKTIKEVPDEHWPVGHLWHELNNRRPEEKTISYAESHDQALVGDQTLIFRLIGADMYEHMHAGDDHLRVNRGIALHKMIRLITLATAGNGYLDFMGNEFGHPEWIDFPREGNDWSHYYARRQWSLADNQDLKYHFLADFDREMIEMARRYYLLAAPEVYLLREHTEDKVLAFQRAGLLFVFNFHPFQSHQNYRFWAPEGEYRVILDTDSPAYGGHGRLQPEERHVTFSPPPDYNYPVLSLYLPSRSAIVMERISAL